MTDWKKTLLTLVEYLTFGLLSLVILTTIYQGWAQKLDSRWFSTVGFVLITALTVLFWKKMALATRVQLLLTYLIVLIGCVALYYGTEAKESFRIANLSLAFLVNLLIFISLSVSMFFILRGIKLSRNVKIVIGALGGLFSIPFLIGLIKDIPVSDLFQGAGFIKFIPWFLQPATLGVVLLLPITCVFLLIDLWRAARDPMRSTFRSFLSLFSSLIPLAVGVMAMMGQAQTGLVARYYADHGWMNFKKTEIVPSLSLDWSSAPVQPLAGANFWVEWEGVVKVPKKGKVQFQKEGDGRGFLYIDGKRVLHEGDSSAEIELEAGTHSLRAGAIQDKGKGKVAFKWKRPGDETFTPIEAKSLGHTDGQTHWRRSPRQAAQVGAEWLQSASVDWQKDHSCFGCHVQGQVVMGLTVAKKNNYLINEQYYQELVDFIIKKQNEDGTYHSGNHNTATQFAALGLAYYDEFRGSKKDPVFLKSVDWLVKNQTAEGEIVIDHNEAPIDQGSIMTTANSVMVFMEANKQTGDKKYQAAAEKGLAWITAAKEETTQDKIFKILVFTLHGNAQQKQVAQALVEQVKKEQVEDGGWKESPAMKGSNAYATGQVLYAFKLAGVSVNSPEFGKGVRFLLDRQKVLGDWPAENTQAHRPSEFVATMWAVIGLAGSFGEIIPEIVDPKDKTSVQGTVPVKAQVTNFTESEIKSVTFDVDGVPLANVVKDKSAENFFITTWNGEGAAAGEHKIHVVATNKEGKQGEHSITVFTGLGVKVKFTNPQNGAVLTGPLTLEARAEGQYGQTVQKVEFFVNGAKMADGIKGEMPHIYQAPWDATTQPEGNYQIKVEATSSMGQKAQDTITVSKRQALAIKITTPQSGQTLSGPQRCVAELTNLANVQVSHVEFLLGSKSLGMTATPPYDMACNFSGEPLGPNTLTAVATTAQEQRVQDSIPIAIGEDKGPGYLKVQLQNLDEASGEQVLYFPPDNIELVVDMSGSMWEQIQGRAKIEIAKEVLAALVRTFPKTANLALRVYSHRSKTDCKDTELLVPFGKVDPETIISKVNALKPKGMTPIDFNLREAWKDIQGQVGSKVIIFVTDGIESCKGDPVKAAQDLMAAGLKLKIHLVGFNISHSPDAVEQLKKVAEIGQGKFFMAESAEELSQGLAEAVKVTYSVYDADNRLVYTKPLGTESNELMSGTYRIDVALDPPLVLSVKIDKGRTSEVNVIRQNKAFRIESQAATAPVAKPAETLPAAPAPAPSAPAAANPPPPQSMPSVPPAAETRPQPPL